MVDRHRQTVQLARAWRDVVGRQSGDGSGDHGGVIQTPAAYRHSSLPQLERILCELAAGSCRRLWWHFCCRYIACGRYVRCVKWRDGHPVAWAHRNKPAGPWYPWPANMAVVDGDQSRRVALVEVWPAAVQQHLVDAATAYIAGRLPATIVLPQDRREQAA